METRRLEVFVALVDIGGFKQAADALFITQPALSQQIARLEREVGVQLIDRSTRPLSVTEAGKEFYFRCRKVLDAMRDIDQLRDEARDVRFGRVRIGIVPAMLFSWPVRAIRSFIESHPGAEVVLRNLATIQLIEELEQGNLDVGILLTQPELKGLSSAELFSEDYLICLPVGHRLAEQQEVSFAQLRDERIIQGPRVANPEGYDAVVAACMGAGFSPRNLSVPGSYLDHAGMVSAGMGVCVVPVSFAELRPAGVVYRRIANPTVGLTASISWYQRRLEPVGETFVQHCIDEFAGGAEPQFFRKEQS